MLSVADDLIMNLAQLPDMAAAWEIALPLRLRLCGEKLYQEAIVHQV